MHRNITKCHIRLKWTWLLHLSTGSPFVSYDSNLSVFPQNKGGRRLNAFIGENHFTESNASGWMAKDQASEWAPFICSHHLQEILWFLGDWKELAQFSSQANHLRQCPTHKSSWLRIAQSASSILNIFSWLSPELNYSSFAGYFWSLWTHVWYIKDIPKYF